MLAYLNITPLPNDHTDLSCEGVTNTATLKYPESESLANRLTCRSSEVK